MIIMRILIEECAAGPNQACSPADGTASSGGHVLEDVLERGTPLTETEKSSWLCLQAEPWVCWCPDQLNFLQRVCSEKISASGSAQQV